MSQLNNQKSYKFILICNTIEKSKSKCVIRIVRHLYVTVNDIIVKNEKQEDNMIYSRLISHL